MNRLTQEFERTIEKYRVTDTNDNEPIFRLMIIRDSRSAIYESRVIKDLLPSNLMETINIFGSFDGCHLAFTSPSCDVDMVNNIHTRTSSKFENLKLLDPWSHQKSFLTIEIEKYFNNFYRLKRLEALVTNNPRLIVS